MYVLAERGLTDLHGVGQPQAVAPPPFTPAEASAVDDIISRGSRNENALANKVFFDRYPARRGQTLTPGTAAAREWITIRDRLVRPKLAAVSRSIPPRLCCILAPVQPLVDLAAGKVRFSATSNIADPDSLGTHLDASEVNGIVYTGRAGFIDLSHLREECDLTEFVWTRLQGAGGSPVTIPTVQGEAKIIRQVPRDRWVAVARAIAFDDGLGHEISTYDAKTLATFFQHVSAFSPEDLCSNFVGTVVARLAIGEGGIFAAKVTTKLRSVLKALGAQSPAETRKACDLVNGRWVDFPGIGSDLKVDYLKRRNFGRTPFKAGHPSDAKAPSWLGQTFGDAESFYTYSHTAGRTIPKTDFAAEITRIRADAKSLYGNDFDKP